FNSTAWTIVKPAILSPRDLISGANVTSAVSAISNRSFQIRLPEAWQRVRNSLLCRGRRFLGFFLRDSLKLARQLRCRAGQSRRNRTGRAEGGGDDFADRLFPRRHFKGLFERYNLTFRQCRLNLQLVFELVVLQVGFNFFAQLFDALSAPRHDCRAEPS